MVFSSIAFLSYFLPLFFLLYFVTPNKFKNYLIVAASIFFYSWGAPKFIFVILGTTFLDFILVRAMYQSTQIAAKKFLLSLSVLMNVGLLFYFKYCNFFIDNINDVLQAQGIAPWKLLEVVLPIGISFYTFETLTYVIDVYRKEHAPLQSFHNYLLYIIFFPKLIAGPIVRYHEIADQITNRFATFSYAKVLKGFHRFAIGLGKKVLIANTLGLYADMVFQSDLTLLSANIAWLGAIAYTFQIYFDFSGYSDMAIGLAQMMGFTIPENFNNPYTSSSITGFWRTWHISLGKWMRNYLYIPLGGNRSSKYRLYFNLTLVFLASGLWHGAQWTFIIWGLYHGTFLVLERAVYGKQLEKISKWISVPITFTIVVIGWVFFKAENVDKALQYLEALFHFSNNTTFIEFNLNQLYYTLAAAIVFSFFVLFKPFEKIQTKVYFSDLNSWQTIVFTLASIALFMVCVAYVAASDFNPFIYFRF